MNSGFQRMRFFFGLRFAAATGVLVASSLIGCALLDGAEEDAIFGLTATGAISLGFEDSTFLPCQSTEAWWLSWYDGVDLWGMYDEKASRPHEQLYAVLRGDRSQEGSYGHLSGYDRIFVVTEIIELRNMTPDDCPRSGILTPN